MRSMCNAPHLAALHDYPWKNIIQELKNIRTYMEVHKYACSCALFICLALGIPYTLCIISV